MLTVTAEKENGLCTVHITGKVDSTNAAEFETKLTEADTETGFLIDIEGLEYISSAGLRVFLKFRKKHPDLEIKNASTEVYEILDMTGFTEMIKVSRAYRRVSVEGCEVVGQGANGKVYRIDPDTVVKVYLNADSLKDIEHEREVARKALILGVPTAISYDVVKVDDHYASMFEMINAKSFSKLIIANPQNLDEYAEKFISLLKLIHSIEAPEGELPSRKDAAYGWVKSCREYLSDEQYDKLYGMVAAVPESNHLIHGDYHTKNIMLQNDEVITIDMDTLSVGHPLFELVGIYNAFQGFGILDHSITLTFLGFDYDTATRFWKKCLELYYDTTDPAVLEKRERQIKTLSMAKLLRWSDNHHAPQETKEFYHKELIRLLEEVDSLV